MSVEELWASLKASVDEKRNKATRQCRQKESMKSYSAAVATNTSPDTFLPRTTAMTNNSSSVTSEHPVITQADVACLLNEDRGIRHQALKKMETAVQEMKQESILDHKKLLHDRLGRLLCFALSDPSDRIREASISLLRLIFQKFAPFREQACLDNLSSEELNHFAENLLEDICSRRFGKEIPAREPCEELRLGLTGLVSELVPFSSLHSQRTQKLVLIHVDRALSDQHPGTKKEASRTLKIFLQCIQTQLKPSEGAGASFTSADANSLVVEEESQDDIKAKIFELQQSIAKRLICNCYHQHSRIRSESFCALQDLVLYNARAKDSEMLLGLEENLGKLFFQVALDRIASVRKTGYSVLIRWTTETKLAGDNKQSTSSNSSLNLSKLLVCCLLVGCVDEAEEIQRACLDATKNLSFQFHLKKTKQQDSCNTLNSWLASYLIQKAKQLLSSWSNDDRLNSVRLLHVFLVLADGNLLPSEFHDILKLLIIAASNEDQMIARFVIWSTHVVGATAGIEVCLECMIKILNTGKAAGATEKALTLLVASETFAGCQTHDSFMLSEDSNISIAGKGSADSSEALQREFVQTLFCVEFRKCEDFEVKRQLKNIVIRFVRCLGSRCKHIVFELFLLLLTPIQSPFDLHLSSMTQSLQKTIILRPSVLVVILSGLESHCQDEIEGVSILASSMKLETYEELADLMFDRTLKEITQNYKEWIPVNQEFLTFCQLLRVAPVKSLQRSFAQISEVFSFFMPNHHASQPVRLSLLLFLESLVCNEQFLQLGDKLIEVVVSEWILLAMTWRAGKTAACIRYVASSVLGAIFEQEALQETTLARLIKQEVLLPSVYQSLDEDYFMESRLMASYILHKLTQQPGHSMDTETVDKLATELLARLEDPERKIRGWSLCSLEKLMLQRPLRLSVCQQKTILQKVKIHQEDGDKIIRELAQRITDSTLCLQQEHKS